MNTTTPTPPKGRRWLREGEIIRKWDRVHWGIYDSSWHLAVNTGCKTSAMDANICTYSRGISHRKKTQK